ncbi:phosphatidylserine decarboxylase [Dapis sp. BLCC M172]|uniref:phosphatidylserine decarboxylase n=1 Tax=Dapis sp. BLCC M172 TaxID=2975281 RepID=UPI003CF0E2E5
MKEILYTNPLLTPEMEQHMDKLQVILSNPVVEAAYNQAVANVVPIIEPEGIKNLWFGTSIDDFLLYFRVWFTFLPSPDGELGGILPFTYFYRDNPAALYFLNYLKSKSANPRQYTCEIFDWTKEFILIRGQFMDSPDSTVYIEDWLNDPTTGMEDYIYPDWGFNSFNEFFTRELNLSANPRPIPNPQDDSIVVASADSQINFLEADLTLTTSLKVKTRQINVAELFAGSKYAQYFEGGTAVSCALMPYNYHHYHSPVNGKIVESQDLPGIYNGLSDETEWSNSRNMAESFTDFSIFEDFHRAYYIIETEQYGYVGLVAVGLNTISRIMPSLIHNESIFVSPGGMPIPIKKGEEMGHFAYGGSKYPTLPKRRI